MICVVASATEGFDALATNWQIAEEIAAENGNTMDRSKLRLVAPIHIAETRAQAEANVMFGIEKWMDYHFKNTPAMQERTKGMSPLDIARKIRGGVVGTPDDVIALIERLQEKQGEFGCFLHSAHNWADWEQTKKSYELYARFVVPHIRKSNRSRVESLERFAANESEIRTAQTAAVSKMFDQHNRERQAKGKKTVELPAEVARKK
jgi:limonene 1,2-monooxygenase